MQQRLTLFCLNNAGSEAIDDLSSARKWLRQSQKPGRAPRASASHRSSLWLNRGSSRRARPLPWSKVNGWELEPYLVFSTRTCYGEILGRSEGRSCLAKRPCRGLERSLLVQPGPPAGVGEVLSHFRPEDRVWTSHWPLPTAGLALPLVPCLLASWPQTGVYDELACSSLSLGWIFF